MDTKLFKPTQYFVITLLVTFFFEIIAMIISYQPGGESMFVSFLIPDDGSRHHRDLDDPLFGIQGDVEFVHYRLHQPSIDQTRKLSSYSIDRPGRNSHLGIDLNRVWGDPSQLQFAEGFSFSIGMAPSLLVLILAAIFEEVGWRGYGMDSLRKNKNYFTATLIFAGLWALWHLPLFFIQGTYQNEIAQ